MTCWDIRLGWPVDPGRSAGPPPHRPPRGAISSRAPGSSRGRRPTAARGPADASTPYNHYSNFEPLPSFIPVLRLQPSRSKQGWSNISVSMHDGREPQRTRATHACCHPSDITTRIIFARRGKYPHIDRARLNLMQLLHWPSPGCSFIGRYWLKST